MSELSSTKRPHSCSGGLSRRRAVAEILAAVGLLATFHAMGSVLGGWNLHLGSVTAPTPAYGRFLGAWGLFGAAAALLLALGLWRALAASGRDRRLGAAWRQVPDWRWVLWGSLIAFLLPAALRVHLLLGMPLTDDEGAYRFSAEILATGRLYLPSPPLKLFFDNVFLINDGKLYSQYFLGWPALMVPGVWLGLPGLMNALYSALTVPALFGIVRRLAGSVWAKATIGLYLASPMLMVGAATETSHPSCVMALSWLVWSYLRARRPGASVWSHALVALFFSLAFFIRPTSALGLGAPVLLAWLARAGKLAPGPRLRALAAFALPAVLMAALFLWINQAQNDSWLSLAYNRYYDYSKSNLFRFSLWPGEYEAAIRNYNFSAPLAALGTFGFALLRFNFAFLGWPSSLLFMFFARGAAARLLWRSVLFFFGIHFFVNTVGVDTFAPMHYYEPALPGLVLSAIGMRYLMARLERFVGAGVLVPMLAAALVAVTLAGYVPVRFKEIHQLAKAIQTPHEALAEAGIESGVVFAPEAFIHHCKYQPSRGFLFSRPNNDPGLENDVLWLNHLSVDRDRELMARHFPDRQGYVMVWLPDCKVAYLPLEDVSPSQVPPALPPHLLTPP